MDTWESVKPILERLWLREDWKLGRIVREMRDSHHFHRVERQYKTQFGVWGWSKNVRKSDMTKTVQRCRVRAAASKFSTQVTIKGKLIDNEKVRRAIKGKIRADTESLALTRDQVTTVDGHVLPFTNNFFLKWNLPYAAMRHSYVKPFDHTSPFEQSTPYSNIEVTTPLPAASPNDAPSPTVQVMKKLKMVDRACMFAQGHHEKLLTLLDGEERRALSDWLYQYWFFCFKTAKHWGKGPKIWRAELLRFEDYRSTACSSLPGTPQDLTHSSVPHNNDEPMPSNLCRWYIHVRPRHYAPLSRDGSDPWALGQQDTEDDAAWPPWSPREQQTSLQTRLRDALEHNDFSPTSATDLPVDIPQIAKAADERRSNELLIESLGFSIMSRNLDQVDKICRQLDEKGLEPVPLHPFHLATSFLDGSKLCCDAIDVLACYITGAKVHETYLNEHGHTILDNLMIAIIKSHTSAKPVVVDDEFKSIVRFVGEEVDICGRWDADSACVRQLHANSIPSIPPSWKHKFCNTSIQTVCHCITRVFNSMPNRLLLETPSGLYIRRCFDPDCGKKLQLQPLHSLVVTAYHLATQGRDEEDLFGVLACALCLMFHGFDPSIQADLSVAALLSPHSVVQCDHEELTAAGLAEHISSMPEVRDWSAKLQTGWTVLAGVLRRCEAAHAERVSNVEWPHEEDCVESLGYVETRSCFARKKDIGMLWSSVQAELLSYRRVNDELGWQSQFFSMEALRKQLEHGEELMVGYAEHNLLNAHCACHSFGSYPLTTLSEAMDPNLANLDLWGRATYGEMEDGY